MAPIREAVGKSLGTDSGELAGTRGVGGPRTAKVGGAHPPASGSSDRWPTALRYLGYVSSSVDEHVELAGFR